MNNKTNDTYSLSHTSWKCQYHVVFAPKYRRKAIYGKLKAEVGKILRELCERKGVTIKNQAGQVIYCPAFNMIDIYDFLLIF